MDCDREALYAETIHRFLTVYRYLRRFSRQLHEAGISGRKMAALRYLLEAGPRTVGQLRQYLYISDSSTSQLIASLEQMGYVTRTRSEADNRVVIVSLTPAGRETSSNIELGGVPLLRERLKTLPSERLARIHAAMTDMMEILEIENGC
ncbi:MAG: winged helix-turn-helix transcriptional regulator [Anaerolineae bacterium]|nr:winged helix-turn-helix transcriptional regulator [Anaerolineae bacterium]